MTLPRPDDRHYVRRKADLDDRPLQDVAIRLKIPKFLLIAPEPKKQAIEAEKLTGDNIYKVLIYFEKLYGVMNEGGAAAVDRGVGSLEIQICPERQPNIMAQPSNLGCRSSRKI